MIPEDNAGQPTPPEDATPPVALPVSDQARAQSGEDLVKRSFFGASPVTMPNGVTAVPIDPNAHAAAQEEFATILAHLATSDDVTGLHSFQQFVETAGQRLMTLGTLLHLHTERSLAAHES